MGLRLHNVGGKNGFSDGKISYLSGATVPGGDASFQDAAPVGSFYTLTTSGITYKKTVAGIGTAAWSADSAAAAVVTNTANIATNTVNIATNTTNIATNASDLAAEIIRATNSEALVQTNLDNFILTKDAANGLASLDANSQIPTSQIPAIALSTVSTVVDEVAQLALVAQSGDVAIRSDLTQSAGNVFMHNGGIAGTMADWTPIDAGGFAVSSVNGQVGTIVLGAADVGADTSGSAALVQTNLDAEVIRATTAESQNAAQINAIVNALPVVTSTTGTLTSQTVDSITVNGAQRLKWTIVVASTGTPANVFSMDLTSVTDGTNIDWDEDGVLELGADILGLDINVTLVGGTVSLVVTTTESVTIDTFRV